MFNYFTDAIRGKLANPEVGGWRELCQEYSGNSLKLGFLELTGSTLSKGGNPVNSCQIANDLLFNNIEIQEVDVLVRLL